MGEISKERAEEEANLMRQGAGNYANLCGVLAGFVAVIIVLVLTPGFFPSADSNMVLELLALLLTIASFGYIFTAISFIGISHKGLWDYESMKTWQRALISVKHYFFCSL